MDKLKLMILGASELQLPAIKCANSMGIETIVIDMDPKAIGIKDSSKFYNISTLDFDRVFKVANAEKINGIVTICSDKPMPVIAKIGEVLGLNTISYETALKATNKYVMRESLKKSNVPIPFFYKCSSKAQYKDCVKNLKGKYICKPVDNSGSRGIFLVESKEQSNQAYDYSVAYSSCGDILVEEYMDGPEVSVECFVTNGVIEIIQITDKLTTGAPFFVEKGHTEPSSLDRKVQEKIKTTSIQAINAIELKNGPAHIEIIITSDGPKIVELGARLGGDHITTDLVPLSTGINLVKLTILNSLGIDSSVNKIFDRYSAIRFFLNDVTVDKRALTELEFEDLHFVNMSLENSEVKSSNDRKGYYIVSANTRQELLDKINVANKIFKLEEE